METAFHLGVHCTDRGHLIRELIRSTEILTEVGVAAPSPALYREELREMALKRKSFLTEAHVNNFLNRIGSTRSSRRVVFSWDNFICVPTWSMKGRLYAKASRMMDAYSRIFPNSSTEFFLGVKSPIDLLQSMIELQGIENGNQQSIDEFLAHTDIRNFKWAALIREIKDALPRVSLTIWRDETAPIFSPEILNAMTGGYAPFQALKCDELLRSRLNRKGLNIAEKYLNSDRIVDVSSRRAIASILIGGYSLTKKSMGYPNIDIDGQGRYNFKMAYDEDIEEVKSIPGVRFIDPTQGSQY